MLLVIYGRSEFLQSEESGSASESFSTLFLTDLLFVLRCGVVCTLQ